MDQGNEEIFMGTYNYGLRRMDQGNEEIFMVSNCSRLRKISQVVVKPIMGGLTVGGQT
jgi:hypothetical protein